MKQLFPSKKFCVLRHGPWRLALSQNNPFFRLPRWLAVPPFLAETTFRTHRVIYGAPLDTGEALKADSYVFALGPWLGRVFPFLKSSITPTRQEVGHVSVQTTERYLGCKQRIRSAVNDRIGIEPNP
jgi:hypothetical protein